MPDQSADLSDLRDQLVAANHILVAHRVLDAFGHVSARVDEDSFLISRNLAPGSVTADDLQLHHLAGGVDSAERPYLETHIHAEIYRARPDVRAIVHSHSASILPFGLTDTAFVPVMHMASFLGDAVPVYDQRDAVGDGTDLLVTDEARGRALATTLGDRTLVLMRGHGSTAVGGSIPEVTFRAIYAETNASVLLATLPLGSPVALSPAESSTATASIGGQIARAWNVWRSAID
ncbi:Ribulose-5-phosphate 4-epimerase and related epimerases and aldolases [Actinomycetales bacterium JB111]|nr:Ribulose-5-phosphate 4-epimerase and related epimerases and aldolases [Actinomycetales bacterium JB111]